MEEKHLSHINSTQAITTTIDRSLDVYRNGFRNAGGFPLGILFIVLIGYV